MPIGLPPYDLEMWFEYRLTGTGWAEAGIGDADNNASLTASYTADALGDLLHAVWRLQEGEAAVRCSWEEEPGEYRWIMRRDGQMVSLQVLQFDDYLRPAEDHAGQVVFETRQDLSTFAKAIALGASQTLEQLGEAGYKDKWGTPFPTQAFERIHAHLRRERVTLPDTE